MSILGMRNRIAQPPKPSKRKMEIQKGLDKLERRAQKKDLQRAAKKNKKEKKGDSDVFVDVYELDR